MTENANSRFDTASALVRFKYFRALCELAGDPAVRFNANLWGKSRAGVGRERATPSIPGGDGLLTPKMAARYLGISVKTLTGHTDDGEIRYINVGRGKKKKRRMYTRPDLEEFKERRAQREVKCLSTGTRKARSTTTTSNSKVIAFTALRDARTREKPRPSSISSGTERNSKPG